MSMLITVKQAVKHSNIRKQTSIKKTVFEQGHFSLWQNVVMSATSERIQYFIVFVWGAVHVGSVYHLASCEIIFYLQLI